MYYVAMGQKQSWGDAEFLNVDMSVKSKHDLAPLAAALGKHVDVMYLGPEAGMCLAYFELARFPKDIRQGILGYVKLLKRLTPQARKLWKSAEVRDFSIGIRAGIDNSGFVLDDEVLKESVRLGAQIVFYVYSADLTARSAPPRKAGRKERPVKRTKRQAREIQDLKRLRDGAIDLSEIPPANWEKAAVGKFYRPFAHDPR